MVVIGVWHMCLAAKKFFNRLAFVCMFPEAVRVQRHFFHTKYVYLRLKLMVIIHQNVILWADRIQMEQVGDLNGMESIT